MIALVELAGAIALLLWGIRMVRTGILRAFGTEVHQLARRVNGKLLPSVTAGLVIAAALQSSLATAMMSASFAGQGVISAATSFLIIMGADVGTAIAVLVVSRDLGAASPLLLCIGVFGFLATDNRKWRSLFRAFSGLGLILLALSLISATATRLTGIEDLQTVLMILIDEPILLVAIGAVLTLLTFSGLAMVLFAASLLTSGLFDPQGTLYFVCGANIGSGLLPFLSNWNGSKASRVPVTANLIVRAVGVLATLPFISPTTEALLGIVPLESLAPAFHLGLNLGVALSGILLMPLLLKLANALIAELPSDEQSMDPRYLDDGALESPATALAGAKREALHMADIAQNMVSSALPVLRNDDRELCDQIVQMDDHLDRLFFAIKKYIAEILRSELSDEDTRRALDILAFTANMEHIGDIVEGGLMQLAIKKADLRIRFSTEGMGEICELHALVAVNFDLAINTFLSDDPELAHQLYASKAEVKELQRQSVTTHIDRLGSGLPDTIVTSSIHLDVLRDLSRINSHLTIIADPVLNAAGEVKKVKWKRRKSPIAE